jgi:hypothetical protein
LSAGRPSRFTVQLDPRPQSTGRPVSLILAQFDGFSELDHQGVLMLAHAKLLLVLSCGSPHFKHENQLRQHFQVDLTLAIFTKANTTPLLEPGQ